ncbi:excisionase family DNA-binding protein [Micromonospora parathelypteridis]|uniref:Excisionase family DNA binding protein n=1 Tax=Micromonospora parathelypteridis TaxID=1839617 RepID=A0A840W5E0_9ACTN|nr:helix-turn-helix domain-containing protein [Micromonospora parathelypteridis]MBB5479429.1 excisionase family DNA binding protein [Micromonospora parathelypteridis]GGO29865.1 hypothetical protein GCM10011576_56890 [Micromonospora parathelypteridis]
MDTSKSVGNWLTIDQVAEMLSVSYWTVDRLIRARELTGVRIGRARRLGYLFDAGRRVHQMASGPV